MLNLTELEEEYKLEMQLQSKVKSTIRNYSKIIKKFIEFYIGLKVTKNGKPRKVVISKIFKKALMKLQIYGGVYFEKVDKISEDYLFVSRTGKKIPRTNINDAVYNACNELGIPRHKAYTYNFRHTSDVQTLMSSKNMT